MRPMRFLVFFFILLSSQAIGSVESTCHVSRGIFWTRQYALSQLSFFTYADIFTLNNANTLKLVLDGERITFLKLDMRVGETTTIRFKEVNPKSTRKAFILINKMPSQLKKNRKFSGQLIVSELATKENQVFHFYCRF